MSYRSQTHERISLNGSLYQDRIGCRRLFEEGRSMAFAFEAKPINCWNYLRMISYRFACHPIQVPDVVLNAVVGIEDYRSEDGLIDADDDVVGVDERAAAQTFEIASRPADADPLPADVLIKRHV